MDKSVMDTGYTISYLRKKFGLRTYEVVAVKRMAGGSRERENAEAAKLVQSRLKDAPKPQGEEPRKRGRPPVPEDDRKTYALFARVPQSMWDWFGKLDNKSEHVRRALEDYMRNYG